MCTGSTAPLTTGAPGRGSQTLLYVTFFFSSQCCGSHPQIFWLTECSLASEFLKAPSGWNAQQGLGTTAPQITSGLCHSRERGVPDPLSFTWKTVWWDAAGQTEGNINRSSVFSANPPVFTTAGSSVRPQQALSLGSTRNHCDLLRVITSCPVQWTLARLPYPRQLLLLVSLGPDLCHMYMSVKFKT